MSVKVNYAAARKCANDLINAGDECASVGAALKKTAGGIGQFWEGNAAKAFIERVSRWDSDMKAIDRDFADLARRIEAKVNEIEAADRAGAARGARVIASLHEAAKSAASSAGVAKSASSWAGGALAAIGAAQKEGK